MSHLGLDWAQVWQEGLTETVKLLPVAPLQLWEPGMIVVEAVVQLSPQP